MSSSMGQLLACLFFGAFLATASQFNNETDRLALLDIKAQIIDDPMQVTSSWNDSSHFCRWRGILCGQRHHQRVTALDLSSFQLAGTISPSIGNLSFLRDLDLSDNSFHGEIPLEIGLLSRLEAIGLANNSLEGEIPANISGCSHLSVISLNGNKLVGNVPWEALVSLPRLAEIYIDSNNLTGTITLMGNLSSLESFSAQSNRLEGTISESIGRLKSLTYLDLSLNNFHGPVPLSVYNLSSLTSFSVADNRLQGSLPQNLGMASPSLEVFVIWENQFTGAIPGSLWNASNLLVLDLSANGFTGGVSVEIGLLKKLQYLNLQTNILGTGKAQDLDFMSSLVNCSDLRVLYLGDSNFGGVLPDSISNLSSSLRVLFMAHNQISGSIPPSIGELTNLDIIGLFYNQLTGHIPSSICKLHKLQDVGMGKNRLSGEIPSCIGNLTSLNKLWLEQNNLEGSIPPSFGNCQHLLLLKLYGNNLSGNIPRELMSLSSFSVSLDLNENRLTGFIPPEVGNLRNLVKLNLSHNQLSGQIPSSISGCESLVGLYLDHNSFEGSIPESFKSLRGVEIIDLSHNNLSGEIPKPMGTIPFLRKLNLSFNDLEGEVPVEGVFTNATRISVSGNNKLCGGVPALNLPICPENKPKKQRNSVALLFTIIPSVCGLLGISLALCYIIFKNFRKSASSPTLLIDDLPKTISFAELFKATNGFSSTNLIGKGAFSSVYRGALDQNEAVVAVKVLNLTSRGSSKSFIAECKALRNVRHRNLIKILTCCSAVDFQANEFKALIFEFMPNGNLDMWLHPPRSSYLHEEPKSLNFVQRLNIAVGVASALDYLHKQCQTPIIHCDVKPSNILLDDDMVACVSDFGLARFFKQHDSVISSGNCSSSIGVMGTVGYAAPEYGMGSEVSTNGDVYSYGILLLELFTGKGPTDEMFKSGLNLHKFAEMALPEHVMEIVDSKLLFEVEKTEELGRNIREEEKGEKIQDVLIMIFRIAVACSKESPRERMDISDALKELQSIQNELVNTRT